MRLHGEPTRGPLLAHSPLLRQAIPNPDITDSLGFGKVYLK